MLFCLHKIKLMYRKKYMKVDVVGTSCTWYTRNNTSFIIDDTILFDVPAGNYKDILKRGNIFRYESVFVSHWHSDHIGDLGVLTTRFLREKVKNPDLPKLKVYSKLGLDEYLIAYSKMKFSREDETDINLLRNAVDFIEIKEGDEIETGGYKVKVYSVDHNDIDCFGFTFTDKTGKTVAFSGDTRLCDSLEKMLSVSDFGFIDMAATFDNPNHLHFEGFVELSKKYPNCKMFPVHTSDPSQELAVKNNLNYLNDNDILYL